MSYHHFLHSPLSYWKQKANRRALLFWAPPVCTGFAATLLAKTAGLGFSFFETMSARWWWWPFLALPLGGLALTWFLRRLGPGAEGSGIQQTIAAMKVVHAPERLPSLVSLRLALVKFIAVVGGLGSGFVLGLEGPTVQIGAGIFNSFRRFLPSDADLFRRRLIAVGGAAGIAAAFNAPLAGLMFAFEEMSLSTKGHTPARLALAVILSGLIAQPLFGWNSYFGHIEPLSGGIPLRFVPPLAVLALSGGLLGGAFSWLVVRASTWLPSPVWRFRLSHPYIYVLCSGLIVALCGLAVPIFGSGMETTHAMLAEGTLPPWYYLPCKFMGLLATYLTGLPGGIFAPSFSLGAGLGSWFAPLVGPHWQSEFIAVGMVAVLAGVTRAPLTAAFIMLEMTNGHSMTLPALGAAFCAAWMARFFRVRFYHELAERILRHGYVPHPSAKETRPQSGPLPSPPGDEVIFFK